MEYSSDQDTWVGYTAYGTSTQVGTMQCILITRCLYVGIIYMLKTLCGKQPEKFDPVTFERHCG